MRMIVYKIDVLEELKDAGYNTTRIRREKIFGETTLQKLREKDPDISIKCLDRICRLLDCQPGNIFKYKEDEI